MKRTLQITIACLLGIMLLSGLYADPCGMVPPIFTGDQSPIVRDGLQKTYVFHKDGVETFVIRPGYQGKVDNFGMLIPFPNPPELRKVSDDIFEQVANAIDPPEVVVDLRIRRMMMRGGRGVAVPAMARQKNLEFAEDKLTVLKQEAVGMYEVAVLEAGSAKALKKWMDQNGYKYPEGMDKVTGEYVDIGWCFVAVKTKVAQKAAVNPRPGQRKISPELPSGSVFDGNVQGMGFRFRSEKLVVPMRLSAFNGGDTRNVVYLLTDGPRKIRSIPEEYVMRQVTGNQLFANVTQPLPLRIIGGTEKDIPASQRQGLPARRNPEPKNGVAKDLFAADLLAVSTGQLSLRHEEQEKELLRIGEHFGLRGGEVDKENMAALKDERKKTVDAGLAMLKGMTLTVVDGDFPREVIAQENLTFVDFQIPRNRNDALNYDANQFGPGVKKEGVLKIGSIDWNDVDHQITAEHRNTRVALRTLIGFGVLGMIGMIVLRRPKFAAALVLATGLIAGTAFAGQPTLSIEESDELIVQLENSATAKDAIKSIRAFAMESDSNREKMIVDLLEVVKQDDSLPKRGWAIAALAAIGGQDVDEYLLNVHADETQKQIVRTWAAAARVSMTRTVNGLIEKANLIQKFPALGRPIGIRIVEKLTSDSSKADPEKVVSVTQKVPQLQTALAPTILAFGPEQLTTVMLTAKDQNVRRIAAGYLGSMAQQGNADKVAKSVIEQLQFDSMSNEIPWKNGPLFVPGIQWNKTDATDLVGQLIRWNLWCDINEKAQEQKQIHNNIRSLGLARAAGYQSPGWNEVGCVAWLKAWGAVVGKQGIQTILEEQGVEKDNRYSGVLKGLN
ncbi:MAG: hypothetical protein ACI87E_000636 [Mariniblastus sp.]|jgi:hypothetical protein